MNTFFEPLQKANLISKSEVNLRGLTSIPLMKLLDTVDQVAVSTADPPQPRNESVFSHCASIPMSGGLGECIAKHCRIARADELARFAALYSDCVYFNNFLADTAPSLSHPTDQDEDELRDRLATDLEILLRLRPLIEAGLLVPYSTPHTYCLHCLASHTVSEDVGHRVDSALKAMYIELSADLTIELKYSDELYLLNCTSQKRITGHKTAVYVHRDPPSALKARPSVLKRILRGERVIASKALRRDLAIHEHEASQLLYSAIYQMAVAERAGAAYLTHRQVEIDTLQAISADEDMGLRNSVLGSNLTSIVPFVADVPIRRLTKLRQREEDAFIRYRAALRELVREVENEGTGLSQRTAQRMYVDILAPEISRLNQAVKEAKRDLVAAPLTSSAYFTAAIGLGLYSGLLPTEAAVIGKALGLGKVSLDAITRATQLADTKRNIRQEKFYYLWKVRHASTR